MKGEIKPIKGGTLEDVSDRDIADKIELSRRQISFQNLSFYWKNEFYMEE